MNASRSLRGLRNYPFYLDRIADKIRIRALGKSAEWRQVSNGMLMEVDPDDFADREYFLGKFERDLIATVARCVRAGDCCIDVGAQKGFVTLLMANCVGRSGRVLSFEPDPRASAKLRNNCDRNQASMVNVRDHALGQEEGFVKFHLSSQLGWSTRFPNELAKNSIVDHIRVRVTSFDRLVETGEISVDASRVAFVKIDAEGSETLVIGGMQRFLSAADPVIWCEINPSSLAAAGSSHQAVFDLLRGLGYEIFLPRTFLTWYGAWRFEFQPVLSDFSPPEICNILAFKREGSRGLPDLPGISLHASKVCSVVG